MGHVINPISFRLGYNRYWNSVWSISDLKNYAHLTNQDLIIRKIILSFFDQWRVHSANFVVSDVKILRKFDELNLFVYIYDSSWEEFLGDFYYKFLEKYKYTRLHKNKNSNSIQILENKTALLQHLKYTRSKSIPKELYSLYLKELFSFYVTFVRQKIQKPVYNFIKGMLYYHINKIFTSKPLLNIYFLGLSNKNVTAAFLAKFLAIKLQRSFFLFEVLKTINWALRKLMRDRVLQGYRIKFSGRYSRKQKKVVIINGFGTFSRSSIESRLDYAFSTARLRFSTSGVKVWLAFSSRTSFLERLRKRKVLKSVPKSSNKYKLKTEHLRRFKYLPSSYLIL